MGLQHNIQNEPASTLSVRPVSTLKPETTVADAVSAMREAGQGCVVVVDEKEKPAGTFTEYDLIDLLLKDPEAMNRHIGDHLSPQWGCVRQDSPIACIIRAMQDYHLRFVVVADTNGRAVGLTGQRGMCEYITDHFPRQVVASRVGGKPDFEKREGA